MGRIKQVYEDKLEQKICNDCPRHGDNIVSMSGFPEIIVCDSCFSRYYIEKPMKGRYR